MSRSAMRGVRAKKGSGAASFLYSGMSNHPHYGMMLMVWNERTGRTVATYTGETGEFWPITSGYMKHIVDTSGLRDLLQDQEIITRADTLRRATDDEEETWAARK